MKYSMIFLILITLVACVKENIVNSTSILENEKIAIPTPSNEVNNEKDEQKAVRLAEEFIKINGYTDFPLDKDKITYESIEYTSNFDELSEERKNTLESKGYGFLKERKDEKGWTVVFQYKNLPTKKYGRAVTMDNSFKNLRVEHKDFILKFAIKLENEKF